MLPPEIIYHILLDTDIDTIANYSLTHKNQSIFKETLFWHALFKKSNLPIIGDINWIKKYYRTQAAFIEVQEMGYIMKEDIYQYIYIDIPKPDATKQWIFAPYFLDTVYRILLDVKGTYRDYEFIVIQNPSPLLINDERFTYESVKSLLIKALVLYPECNISTRRNLQKERTIRKGKLNNRHQKMVDKINNYKNIK